MNSSARTKYRTGSLHQRGRSGNYYLRYYVGGRQTNQRLMDEDGRPITTRRKAETAARHLMAPLLHKACVDQQSAMAAKLQATHKRHEQIVRTQHPSLPLSRMWAAYESCPNRPQSGESTLNRYKAVIEAFNKWMGKNHPDVVSMGEVTREHTKGYAAQLKAEGLAPSSFNIYLNNLTTVWATLANAAGPETNPFAWNKSTQAGIPRRNIKAETSLRQKRPLTLEEIDAVLDAAEGSERTLLTILAYTGQRLVDCIKLRWDQVLFEEGIILLVPTRTARTLHIPLLPPLRSELEDRKRDADYILPGLAAAYERDPSAVSRRIREVLTTAGIEDRAETHAAARRAIATTGTQSFRYGYVRIARRAGIPDAAIRYIAGYESIAAVDQYSGYDREAIAALAEEISTKGTSEPLRDVPEWIIEELGNMTPGNWENVRGTILEHAPPQDAERKRN